MKFIPMLFNPDMAKAAHEGTKNQTRRTRGLDYLNKDPHEWVFVEVSKVRESVFYEWKSNVHEKLSVINDKCPYGQPGDIIWVREAFSENPDGTFDYKADFPFTKPAGGWKPNMHMPKKACRTFLEIVSIHPERLNDITEEDAIGEGIQPIYKAMGVRFGKSERGRVRFRNYTNKGDIRLTPIESFKSLWESINGDGSWQANPWVWVVRFKKVEKPINFLDNE
jgi:hypothetical protein